MKQIFYELHLQFEELFVDFRVVDAKMKEIIDHFGPPGKDYNIKSVSAGILIWFKHKKDFLEAASKWADLRTMK